MDVYERASVQSDPDADDDGVDDSIDTGAGAFNDGAGTSGTVVDTAGLEVFVTDADEAGDGVKITVAQEAGRQRSRSAASPSRSRPGARSWSAARA